MRWFLCALLGVPLSTLAGGILAPMRPVSVEPEAVLPLTVHYFASSTCSECSRLKRRIIPDLQMTYGDRVLFRHMVLDDLDTFKLLLAYEKRYGVTDDEALKVFVGQSYLSGLKQIEEQLAPTIEAEMRLGHTTLTPEQVEGPPPAQESDDAGDAHNGEGANLLRDRLRGFRGAAVIAAGLVDGVNPCAFATVVFLVSVLAALRRSRRQVAVAGAGFALGVFLSYLLLGIGGLRILKAASVELGIASGITAAVGGLALGFGICSLIDAWRYRKRGDSESWTLRLPPKLRRRINRLIGSRLRARNLAFASFAAGSGVAILESLCTGQVYLPTLVFLLRDPELAPRAFAWLVAYNVAFMVPLLAVFSLALAGVTSARLVAFSRRHAVSAKVMLGGVFLMLGGLLLWRGIR